ncbi:hypothetical protein EN829_037050 [Mesorhizobium sp. M00.F.Ca.ET.186.01.1.1]|uniref:hypothetical protein n=1 Tax=Brevibacillus borstelensis TaxID=45462 RepID=UPI00113F5139|nr:hypothetical protein [Brevibacillus borstelensis]MCM3591223.1 hypothetical protein [Brevibacillus borstelensis]TGV30400.1 hypothetical protein EN829_037050 [Mesorhizobium sp. M00.F.Ca.ET.186.01.1.1]
MNNSVVQAFGNQFLNAFGIQLPRIVEHVPTEVLTISGEKHIVEDLFRLEDDTLLHMEYQASKNPEDLNQLFVDLMWYHLKIYEKYEKPASTIVVFGPAIEKAEVSRDIGGIKYEVAGVVWLSRWNGDQIAEEFTRKVGQKGVLTDEELSVLAMMPFMHTTGSRLEIATKAVQIANKLDDSGERDLVIRLMKVMAGRLLLTSEDYEQVVQALAKA